MGMIVAAVSVTAFLALSLVVLQDPDGTTLSTGTSKSVKNKRARSKTMVDLSQLEGCTTSVQPPPLSSTWTTKPIWTPSYPNSIDDNYLRSLVTELTGFPQGAKSYYAQGTGFKKCQSDATQTALCMLVHPMVNMKPPPSSPSKRNIMVSTHFVYWLRNPTTALPHHMNVKAIKYHNHVGQVEQASWRRTRDEYFESMLEGYKDQITAWTNLTDGLYEKEDGDDTDGPIYQTPIYLSFEELMDGTTGPETVRTLAQTLQEVGFPTVPLEQLSQDDLLCIWYKGITSEALQQYQQYGYEFSDFLPKYTSTQLSQLQSFLKDLAKEFESNQQHAELVRILQSYIDEIKINYSALLDQ